MDHSHQPVFGRHKVGIEDGNELPFRRFHPFLEGSGLESVAVRSVMVCDWMSQSRVALDDGICDLDGLVGRIVEHLDIELVAWILHLADRLD